MSLAESRNSYCSAGCWRIHVSVRSWIVLTGIVSVLHYRKARMDLADQGMERYALEGYVSGLLGGNSTCGVSVERPSAIGLYRKTGSIGADTVLGRGG